MWIHPHPQKLAPNMRTPRRLDRVAASRSCRRVRSLACWVIKDDHETVWSDRPVPSSAMPVTAAALQLVLDRSRTRDPLGAAIRHALEVIDGVLDDYG